MNANFITAQHDCQNKTAQSMTSPIKLLFFVLSVHSDRNVLPYIDLGVSDGVPLQAMGHFDDGASEAIYISGDGFPFGDTHRNIIYVSHASQRDY